METRMTRKTVMMFLILAGVLVFCPLVVAGDLEPPGAPGSTMKTLDEVEPRIPIPGSNIPVGTFVINKSGSYYLEADRLCSTNGIRVDVNDVTIDMMGYSLISSGGNNRGISIGTRSNVEIRNGTVRDFGSTGIYSGSYGYNRAVRIINIRSIANGSSGIYLGALGGLVKNCTVTQNGSIGILTSSYCVVTGNTSMENAGHGIATGTASVITKNTVSSNAGRGIWGGSSCTIVDNTAYRNGSDGIYVGYASSITNCTSSYNTGNGINASSRCRIVGNNCDYNGYNGIGSGIYTLSGRSRIEGNNVTNNDKGIEINGTNNLIIRNSASGNATDYSFVAGNSYGPIVNVAGTGDISGTTNAYYPWANFRF